MRGTGLGVFSLQRMQLHHLGRTRAQGLEDLGEMEVVAQRGVELKSRPSSSPRTLDQRAGRAARESLGTQISMLSPGFYRSAAASLFSSTL